MVHPDLEAEIADAARSLHFPVSTVIEPAHVERILNHRDFKPRSDALGHVVDMTAVGFISDAGEVDTGQLTASLADAEGLEKTILEDTNATPEDLSVAHRVAQNRLPKEQIAPWLT